MWELAMLITGLTVGRNGRFLIWSYFYHVHHIGMWLRRNFMALPCLSFPLCRMRVIWVPCMSHPFLKKLYKILRPITVKYWVPSMTKEKDSGHPSTHSHYVIIQRFIYLFIYLQSLVSLASIHWFIFSSSLFVPYTEDFVKLSCLSLNPWRVWDAASYPKSIRSHLSPLFWPLYGPTQPLVDLIKNPPMYFGLV